MKIILSRKGFDSSVGGHANPILPDGKMLSLPIPSSIDSVGYGELRGPAGKSLQQVVNELDADARIDGAGAHADPDLIWSMRPRASGWRPSFGQIGAASTHLRNQGVDVGDLFLFYGWFRYTETASGVTRFQAGRLGFHAIYGYLQIGEVISAKARATLPQWLHQHPHATDARLAKATNTIYVAAKDLRGTQNLPGAGVFKLRNELVLTKPGFTRSCWSLDPDIFRSLTISYHTEAAWRDGYFQSFPRAQEYVIHADPKAARWARDLISGSEVWE